MTARRSAALLAATALAAALTACAPASAPTPSPTPTGFASEEEAFAAAEATYRAYVDALNQVDLSDPATFEPVYALLDGEALASEKKTLTKMHADGWSVSGETEVPSIFKGNTAGEILVCQDVSKVAVINAAGESQVSPDRPDVFALDVTVVHDTRSSTGARVVASKAIEDDRC
ncbi:hypothetical protein AB0P19_08725 [Microbacterium oleivorans]|uniref:hypothetical protein n=1 Tax=Microbacterium TaxID=33882 RepID=UPI0033F82B7F